MRGECWVTLANNDEEVWQAIVLARTIRKTQTTRPISISISEQVSQPLEVLLQQEFNTIIRFDTNQVGGNDMVKLWLWKLRGWTKCVYVHPHSYMLKTCEELFLKPAFSCVVDDSTCSPLFHLFVFEPSLDVFRELVKISNSHSEPDGILRLKFEKNLKLQGTQISSSFASILDSTEWTTFEVKPNIVALTKSPLSGTHKNELTTEVCLSWKHILNQEVLPIITQMENKSDTQFLMASLKQHGLTAPVPAVTPVLPRSLEDIEDYKSSIAVIGMSCRLPGANSTEEFWDLLISGHDPVRKFPTDRPRPSKKPNESDDNFEVGFLKCPIDEFDAKFFGLSPREAPFVDPQQRLLLEVVWESLENACINPHSLRETSTAVFVGIWQQEYDHSLPDYDLSANEFHYRYLGNAFSATAGRISNFLGLHGHNYAIESGCSSSANAIHSAVQCLRRGDAPVAIASGVNLVLRFNPFADDFGSFVLSNNFRCKSFDERADGYVRAEGCGAVVLKPLITAVQDCDNILGIIRGVAMNNDGPSTSFGTPNGKAQELVLRKALTDAKVEPCDVSLLEAHGTGTAVGDPIELSAIGIVYSENRTQPLIVSAVKSNIGHTEACAGIAGLIKVLLCMKHKKVPAQLHFQKLNPRIDLQCIPATIPTQVTEWNSEKRIAALSSFSMTGTNVHIIVQATPEYLERSIPVVESRPIQMVGISAKSDNALEALCQKYILYFNANPQVQLNDVALTLNTGRANMSHRIGIVAKDTNQLIEKLEKKYVIGRSLMEKPKMIFLFTGQGSQYFGMAKRLYETSSVFQSTFNRCDVLFKKHLNLSLKEVLWTDVSLLDKTIYCQPAIFAVQFCLVQLWASSGIRPDFVLGHSVGEFCAAVCAGLLSLEDGMKLVVGRSKLVDSLNGGKMLVVKTSAIETRRLIKEFSQSATDGWIDIAAENSNEETVVSGMEGSVQNFANFCISGRIRTQIINAAHAFHSRAMDSVLTDFSKMALTTTIRTLESTYVSGTFARPMKLEEFDSTYWIRHLRDTVRFQEAVKYVWKAASGCKVFVEIGTQPILLGLTMANIAESSFGTFCPSMRKSEDDLICVMNTLSKMYVAGVDICWDKWFTHESKLILPTYPFQRQKYWFHNDHEGLPVSPLIHPIVGRQLQTPMSVTAFSQLLSAKDLPYLSDHRVADQVILPASAYLETIMAAGCQVLQGGRVQVPFAVEDFNLEAALELSRACQVQTIVRSIGGEEGLKFEISIHKQISRDEIDKWKRHAISSFSPSLNTTIIDKIDIAKMHQKMEPVDSIRQFYETVAAAGVQFGPNFQSITRAWKSNDSVLTEVHLPADSSSYICHPIVLDAVIQTYAFRKPLTAHNGITKVTLQLPISIKKFTWYSKPLSDILFVLTTSSENENNSATDSIWLLNDSSEVLAEMSGLQLVSTSCSSFLRSLNTDSNKLPQFFTDLWRPSEGVTKNRFDLDKFLITQGSAVDQLLTDAAKMEGAVLKTSACMNSLFAHFLLRGAIDCRWPWPEVGDVLEVNQWARLAPIDLEIAKTETLMKIAAIQGYLSWVAPNKFQVCKTLCLDVIAKVIDANYETLAALVSEDDIMYQFSKQCDAQLSKVLQGKISSISYLYSEEPKQISPTRLYAEGRGIKEISSLVTAIILDGVGVPPIKGIIRILEVGAGSGFCCSLLQQGLSSRKTPYQLTFTDISPHFVNDARSNLGPEVIFRVFNIEKDPLSQGFLPEFYDIVIAINVVHATTNVSATLENLNGILKTQGLLILGEVFQDLDYLSLTAGFLDGWWRFHDDRHVSPLLSSNQWEQAVEQAGFSDIMTITMFSRLSGAVIGRKRVSALLSLKSVHQTTWLQVTDGTELAHKIAAKMNLHGRQMSEFQPSQEPGLPTNLEGVLLMCTEIPNELNPDHAACHQLLMVCQKLITSCQHNATKPHIVIVTRGVSYIGDAGPGNPAGAMLTSFVRSFANEHFDYRMTVIDLDQDEINETRELEELFGCIWSKDKEMFKALRDDRVYVQRLMYSNTSSTKKVVALPKSTRFRVPNPASKSLNDLQVAVATKSDPAGTEVEVGVRACALNFRDLFVILKPEGFNAPTGEDMNIGMDIAGLVTAVGTDCTQYRVGDAVFGFTDGGGLASHVRIKSEFLLRKPAHMTFALAATIPTAFFTVIYSLQNCAQLQPTQRVLIHVATGGVGLAAIQYAKYVGAEIYATAGSRRKRAYLRSIGIKNVYHSRNTAFSEDILKDTQGRGVDVVLNSLTAPNFKEATLLTCGKGARFVEIGKVNIWTAEEVRQRRPDLKYFIVDLSTTARQSPQEMSQLVNFLEDKFELQVFKGLPHATFSLDSIRQAFFYFQEAKHIGKVVISMPQTVVSSHGKIVFQQNLFHPESTYMITGGLGGIGMEVAKWMNTIGAQNIVLVGRSGPDVKCEQILTRLRATGCRVEVMRANVSILRDCEHILKSIEFLKLPPLRGIMHAAGILSDAIVMNQTWEKLKAVFEPKVLGTWNLHRLTIDYGLEFFTVFSSIVALFGAPGQCTHAAANGFMDSFVHYRNSIGLPATTVNYGPWADVGVAANLKIAQDGMYGLRPFSPKQGILSLEHILRTNVTQTVVADVIDWAQVKQVVRLGHLLEELGSDQVSTPSTDPELKTIFEQILNSTPEECQGKWEMLLETVLKDTLRLAVTDEVPRDQNFSEIGVDSLMAMELRNRLQVLLGEKQLTLSALQDHRTLRSLATHLVQLTRPEIEQDTTIKQRVLTDTRLPVDIQQSTILPLKPSGFKQILLTGATGHIGVNFLPALQSQRTDVLVHCIVRASDNSTADDRLRTTIERYSLGDCIDLSKIRVWAGDLTKPNFGLSDYVYLDLADQIDAIVHCAAVVNHEQEYSSSINTESDPYAVNIQCTVNILRLAATRKTKPVLYSSSLLAVARATDEETVPEDFLQEGSASYGIQSSYTLSKVLCECLMKQALDRGFPVTVMRYVGIVGHSDTGFMPVENEHARAIIMSSLGIYSSPEGTQGGIPVMAVDTACDISVKIFMSDTAQSGVYNLTSGYDEGIQDVVEEVVTKFGIDTGCFPSIELARRVFTDKSDPTKHPLAGKIGAKTFNQMSFKVLRNCPTVEEIIPPFKDLLERHLHSNIGPVLAPKYKPNQ